MTPTWRDVAQEMYGGDRLSLKALEVEMIAKKDDEMDSNKDYHVL